MLNYQRVSCFSHWIGLRENLNRKPMGFYHQMVGLSGSNFPIIQFYDLVDLNVPIEHHPTIRFLWSTRWLLFQVMSNIPKMGQLPTPGGCLWI